jgi:class 3 adenylate cyclase
MSENPNRTLVCSVLFLDIEGYSRKSVSEELSLKRHFNSILTDALSHVGMDGRIVLDTGDGAAVCFLSDPEDSLFAAINVRAAVASADPGQCAPMRVRIGLNLGPVRLLKDINGQVNVIGDGINDAQRVMSFSEPGQILVSRSYFEVMSRLSDDYSRLFVHEGMRTDKHVRKHEVYAVGLSAAEPVKDLFASPIGVRPAPHRSETSTPDPAVAPQVVADKDTPKHGSKKWLAVALVTLGVVIGAASPLFWQSANSNAIASEPVSMPSAKSATQVSLAGLPASAERPAKQAAAQKIEAAEKPAASASAVAGSSPNEGKTSPLSARKPQRASAPARKVAAAVPSNDKRAWLLQMRKDLAVCDAQGFLQRVFCVDKARRTYCGPSHWGEVEECKVNAPASTGRE